MAGQRSTAPGGAAFQNVVDTVRKHGSIPLKQLARPGELSQRTLNSIRLECGKRKEDAQGRSRVVTDDRTNLRIFLGRHRGVFYLDTEQDRVSLHRDYAPRLNLAPSGGCRLGGGFSGGARAWAAVDDGPVDGARAFLSQVAEAVGDDGVPMDVLANLNSGKLAGDCLEWIKEQGDGKFGQFFRQSPCFDVGSDKRRTVTLTAQGRQVRRRGVHQIVHAPLSPSRVRAGIVAPARCRQSEWGRAASWGRPAPQERLQFARQLPYHDLPRSLADIGRPAEQEKWLRRMLGAGPAAVVSPDASNYVELFSALLFLEEVQMTRDIRGYDLFDQVLVADRAKPELCVIKVPGLAEKRPSVLRGDTIFVRGPTGSCAQGYVHYVQLDAVVASFDRMAVQCDGRTYDVRFTYNRTPLRKQHEGLQLIASSPALRRIAPCGAGRGAARAAPLEYTLVRDPAAAREAVDALTCGRHIYLDCEGESLSRHGKLHLLQAGTEEATYLFDMQAMSAAEWRACGLFGLLRDPTRNKAMWDCREDADALYHQFGVRLAGVLDLQLLDVARRGGNDPGAAPTRIRGLKSVARSAEQQEVCTGAEVSQRIAHRPLDPVVLQYSAGDIQCLRVAARKLELDGLDGDLWQLLWSSSERYCDLFRALPDRQHESYYERCRAPWAGPYLPEGVFTPLPAAAVECRCCRRPVATVAGEPCRVCAAIDAARPPPAEEPAEEVLPGGTTTWQQPQLNERQQAAVTRIASMKSGDLRIIFGPPGTGKTVTVVAAIKRVLSERSARVLCAGASNTAADVLAERLTTLLGPHELYRCYAQSRNPKECPGPLQRYSSPAGLSGYRIHPKERLAQFRVIVVTCNAAFYLYSLGLPRAHFTHVFVDEAGQATEPDSVVPLAVAPSAAVVLAGDPRQLGPVVRSPVALRFGLGRSMLGRLAAQGGASGVVTQLTETYRAHEAITALYSDAFYEGSLVPRAPAESSARFTGWCELPNPEAPVLFWHVQGRERRDKDSPSWYNPEEITVVKHVLHSLLSDESLRVREADIGIITPYLKQQHKLRGHFHHDGQFGGVSVRTVEGFQGQERPIIIVTTVRSHPQYLHLDQKFQLGFVAHPQRTNVAISRAQSLLVVVGNMGLLATDPNWRGLIRHARDAGCTKDLPRDIVLEAEAFVHYDGPGHDSVSEGSDRDSEANVEAPWRDWS